MKRQIIAKAILTVSVVMIVSMFSFMSSAAVYAADDNAVTIEINGGARGNIFDEFGQDFSVLIHNDSDFSENVQIKYLVYDEENELVFQNMLSKTAVDSKTDKSVSISIGIKKYGPYTLKCEAILCEDNSRIKVCETTVPFSVINKTTDENVNQDFGVSAHLDRFGDQTENVDIIKSAGFGTIRSELEWYYVEREGKNILKIPDNKGQFQAYVKQSGMDNIMILGFSSKYWVSDEDGNASPSTPPSTDEQMEAFARYCAFMADYYKDSIEYFEIWNEYNLVNFNIPNYDGTMYAKMLKYAYPAIKQANPNAKVVGMSLAGINVDSKYGTSWDVFLEQALSAGAGDYFDILSVHFYQHYYEGFYSEDFFRTQKVKPLKEIMAKYGVSDKPIWQTETGWSTISGEGAKYEISEKNQAIYGVKLYLFSKAEKLWDRLFWYDYQNDGSDPTAEQNNFGLIDAAADVEVSGRAKAAFIAFAGMNKLMANAEYKDRIEKDSADILRFEKPNGESVAALWTDGEENKKVTLSLGTDKIDILDIYSNVKKECGSSNGIYTIEYANEPIYVRGSFAEFEEVNEEPEVKIILPDKSVFTEAPAVKLEVNTAGRTEAASLTVKRELYKDGEIVKTEENICTADKNSMSYIPIASADCGEGSFKLVVTVTLGDSIISQTKEYDVICPDSDEFCDIQYEDSKVIVYGTAAENSQSASIAVTDKSTNQNLYLGQAEINDSREYGFDIGGITAANIIVTVNDGRITKEEFTKPQVSIILTNNSQEIKDVSELKDEDLIEAKVTVDDSNVGKKLSIIIAAYDNNKLLWVENRTMDSANAVNSVNVQIEQADKIERLACFAWDDELKPVAAKFDTAN